MKSLHSLLASPLQIQWGAIFNNEMCLQSNSNSCFIIIFFKNDYPVVSLVQIMTDLEAFKN